MEMNVRDDQKLVEIWLTNAEKIDPVLREGLKKHVVLDNIVQDVFKLCKGKKEKGGRDFSLPPEVHRSVPTARCFFACCTAFSALRRRLKSSKSRVFS